MSIKTAALDREITSKRTVSREAAVTRSEIERHSTRADTMSKYADVHKAGRSTSVPFVPGEDSGARHDRRMAAAMEREAEARAHCQARGVTLAITNGGQHWQFWKGQCQIDWWPSTAKLVFNQRWQRGTHAHDLDQVLRRVFA